MDKYRFFTVEKWMLRVGNLGIDKFPQVLDSIIARKDTGFLLGMGLYAGVIGNGGLVVIDIFDGILTNGLCTSPQSLKIGTIAPMPYLTLGETPAVKIDVLGLSARGTCGRGDFTIENKIPRELPAKVNAAGRLLDLKPIIDWYVSIGRQIPALSPPNHPLLKSDSAFFQTKLVL